MTLRKMKVVFWGTIILGMILPIIVMISVDLVVSHGNLLITLKSSIVSFWHNWGLVLILLHDIPFVVLAFVIKSRLGEKVYASEPYTLRLSETIGAWIVIFIVGFWMNLDVWISLASLSSGFSTAILVYFFFPFYGIIAILVGYWSGWLVGKLILWNRSRKTKEDRLGDTL